MSVLKSQQESEQEPPLVASDVGSMDVEMEMMVPSFSPHVIGPIENQHANLPPPVQIQKQKPVWMQVKMPTSQKITVSLHSPSDQIVGTPFAVSSPKFEYPFPESGTNSTDSIPTVHGISSSSTSSLPSMSSPTLPIATSIDPRSYSPTHPKMCVADPPIPPSLMQKPKWVVGLLGRKISHKSKGAKEGKHMQLLISESGTRRRYSVDGPPELFATPLEQPDDSKDNPCFSSLNRTSSAQC